MIMKKRTYIKPEVEELNCIYGNLLAGSTQSDSTHVIKVGDGGTETNVDENLEPNPNGARSFGDDFGFDE